MRESQRLNDTIRRIWQDETDREEALERTSIAVVQSFEELEARIERIERKLEKRERDERSAMARFGGR